MKKRMMLLLFVLSLLMSIPVLTQAQGGTGTIYVMTNANSGQTNAIVVYEQAANGLLTLAGTFATEGSGHTVMPGNALGAQGPLMLSPDNRWLFAVNAGSNSISVFKIDKSDLTLVQVINSNGDFPVSLTMHRNLLYVLNAGGDGNITGFTQDANGQLTLLARSTRSLNTGGLNPPDLADSPAQVGFNPLGDQLVVTVKGSLTEPKILVFAIDSDGLPSVRPRINMMANVPVAFAFGNRNNLIVTEPFGDGPSSGEKGAVSSYQIAADGSLKPISPSVGNGQLATCWIAITSRRRAYTTNNVNGSISSYKVGPDGSLSLIDGMAATMGRDSMPVDLAITPDNRYLYNVNAGRGTVGMFKIDPKTGDLTALGEIGGLPDDGSAVGIAVR